MANYLHLTKEQKYKLCKDFAQYTFDRLTDEPTGEVLGKLDEVQAFLAFIDVEYPNIDKYGPNKST